MKRTRFTVYLDGVPIENKFTEGVDGLAIDWDEGLEGWWDSPDEKVDSTARQLGYGDFPIEDEAVLYSSRTVTIGIIAHAQSRQGIQKLARSLHRRLGRIVRLRVQDDEEDTYSDGFVTLEWDTARHGTLPYQQGVLTVVCQDPRRLSTLAHTAVLNPVTSGGAGIVFDDDSCLKWPVQFAGDMPTGNSGTFLNDGTATAYPLIRVRGDFPGGFTVTDGAGADIVYKGALSSQTVVLDCLSRTATINGVDVTRNLSSRRFPTVEPGGTLRLSFIASGDGTCEVEVHDTYI